jgi:hypothetical protein
MRNFQLNETGKTTIQRVSSILNPCFQVGFPAEFCYTQITRNRSITNFVIMQKKLFIT